MTDTSNQGGRDVAGETAAAGEGRWDQGTGEVAPGGQAAETDALGRDPAETRGHTRTEGAELITEGAQPGEKGHGDGELEEREDQLTGPGGVQRDRAADRPAVYDPGRVDLEPGDERLRSDPAEYPNPEEQRADTSRVQPELPSDRTVEGGVDPTDPAT